MAKLRRQHIAAVVVLALVVIVGGVYAFRSMSDSDGSVSMLESYLFEHEGEQYLSVLTERSFRRGGARSTVMESRVELRVVDPHTGRSVSEVVLTDIRRNPELQAFRRSGHRLWTNSEVGVRLLDLRTGETLLTQAQLVAQIPELSAGFRVESPTINDYSGATAGLPVVLADGRQAWIDMTPALRLSPVQGEPGRPGYFCGPDHGARPSCEERRCLAFHQAPGSSGMRLGSAPVWPGKGPVEAFGEADASAAPMLRPGLVRLHETECAFELGGDALVLHDSSAVDPKEVLLSRVRRSGAKRWTVPLAGLLPEGQGGVGAEERIEAAVTADGLTLLIGKRRLAVVGVDPETGEAMSSHWVVQ